MRLVFTSQRLETVEGVARFLNEAGIETWIEQGRSYKGNQRSVFSYSDPGKTRQPAVWVVKSDDQPQARALLRQAGLIESTREAGSPLRMPASPDQPAGRSLAMRIRTILLVVLVVLAGFTSLRMFGLA